MDLSQPEVALHIHTTKSGVNNGPHLAVQKRNLDNLYNVRVEGMEEIDPYYDSSQQYQFTGCLRSDENDISSIKQQIDLNIQSALDGFNAALMIMSSGSKIIGYAMTSFKTQISHLDEYRRKKNQSSLTLEYAYLGVTDDCCYDLRNDRRIRNETILQNGIDSLMKSVNCVEQIWERLKLGSKFPFILKVRVSDTASFLGSFVIVDLLNTRFVANTVQTQNGYTFHDSCKRLNETVKLVATPNYIGLIPADSCVLTKTLDTYLGGMNRLNVFLHVEEYPDIALEETLTALDFAQHLQRISCRSVRNHVDSRLEECISKADYYREKYHNAQATIIQMERKYQELETEIEKNKATMQDSSKIEKDTKILMEELSDKEAELQMKYLNLQLEVVYLRCHIQASEGNIAEQKRQHQMDAAVLKYSQRQTISEVEKLELDLADKEQKITELVATLNHKSQQIDELEVFQKQAKILLSESDNKYNKMLRFYERKDNDVKEAIQREQTRWYEKRSIMQNKISNLQTELEEVRNRSKVAQEEWISKQEKLQSQISLLSAQSSANHSARETSSHTVASNQLVVTVDDIAKLKSELEKQANELKEYKSRMDVAKTLVPESKAAVADAPASDDDNPDVATEHDNTTPVPSEMEEDKLERNVAKVNVEPPQRHKANEDHDYAVRKAESKESRRKKLEKRYPTPKSNATKRPAEKKQRNEATSEAISQFQPDSTSNTMLDTVPEDGTIGAETSELTAPQMQTTERALSPELLVDTNVNRKIASAAPTTSLPRTENLKLNKTFDEESKSKLPKKKRKLGSRKTSAVIPNDEMLEFQILPGSST
ncbi:hypothetical protein Unana1_01490 [Umbelopsis nana]